MFSRPKILFLVSLLFVVPLNSIPTYLLNFEFFYHLHIQTYVPVIDNSSRDCSKEPKMLDKSCNKNNTYPKQTENTLTAKEVHGDYIKT